MNRLQPTQVRDKRVTVFGLGHFGGGTAVSRWLVENGARVLVADHSPAEKLAEPVAQLSDLPIEFRLGPEQFEADFTDADLIVASPAIPPHNRFLQAARAAGVPITSEICLFVERCPARVFGVTGTKGKSTTSTLLGRMLATRFTTHVGGNIGRSLLPDLPRIKPDDLVVLELSSFMLEHLAALRWSPHVAVVTMISADHLDWHGSIEKYVEAKRTIVRFQRHDDFAVLNQENEPARSFGKCTAAKVIPFQLTGCRRFTLALSGEHNQLNAQAAFSAASVMGIPWDAAQSAITDFRGLEHRLQVVAEHDGVTFINDSIATIPEAAIAALNSFPAGKVIQIVGGSDKKHLPIDQLCSVLAARAKAVLCIGETGGQICSTLVRDAREMIVRDCGHLAAAVADAKSIARPGDIVLLSPGHPSYDQFVNFEERGAVFAKEANRQTAHEMALSNPAPSDCLLRPATLADVRGILEIEHHSFVHAEERFGEQRVCYLINSARMIVVVAEADSRLLGWVAGFARTRGDKPWGRIYAIAVHPDARGQRLGPRLLEQMTSTLESLGARRLFLEVRPDNHAAIRLYEKAGFATCKLLPNYYGQGHPAQRMERSTTRLPDEP